MFVERSESRVRSARTAFVLFCLLPCAALGGWAAYWSSSAHRDIAAASWAREIGLAVRCERIAHVRPGCVRLANCEINADDGSAAARFDLVEVETTPREVRIRLPVFHATPEACAAVGRMARSWLSEPSRHDRAWLVDVANVRWPDADTAPGTRRRPRAAEGAPDLDAGFRVECVAAGAERAVRIRREPATDDEVRIVRSFDDGQGRIVVEGRIDAAVPAACVFAAIGKPASTITGWTTGSVSADWAGDGWSGEAAGSLDGFDAARISRFFGSTLLFEGSARLELASATFSGGRLSQADASLAIGPGAIAQELLDRLVQVAQCRAGEAYRSGDGGLSSPGVRPFDRVGCALAIDGSGITIRSADPGAGGILTAAGRTVLDAPAEAIATERLAWAFAPRDARPLPATAATAWLLPLLPPSAPSGERR